MFYTIQTQSGLALTSLGVQQPARIGTLTMIASLGVPVGTYLFRVLARIPMGALLGLEFALIGMGFAGMGKAASPAQFVAFATVNQLGCGMILPTLLTWATSGLAFEIRGRGTGAWTATFAIGQFLSGLIITFLGERVGGLLPALLALGAANVLAALLAFATHLRQWSTRQVRAAGHQPH
jgi:MFS family permease